MKKAGFALIGLTLILAIAVALDGFGLLSGPKPGDQLPISQSPVLKYKKLYADKVEEEEHEANGDKGYKEGLEWLNSVRMDPDKGYVPLSDVITARDQYKKQSYSKEHSPNKKAAPLNLDWEELGPDNIGGRTRSIIIDKSNPDLMWAGSVTGGLFYSEDGGLNWHLHPWSQEQKYLGISDMVQDINGNLVISTGEGFNPGNYFGTGLGLFPSYSAPGVIGDGLYRVYRDTSQGWDHMQGSIPTANSSTAAFAETYKVAVSPIDANTIFAATEGGLFVSRDGGATFSLASGVSATFQNKPCVDVEVGPNGTVYAALNKRHYYRSGDGGLSFTEMAGQGGFPGPASPPELRSIYTQTDRMEFATTPEDPNYVYAVLTKETNFLAIFKSTNAGLNWTQVVTGDQNGFNPTGGQGSWGIAFSVDPYNKERLIFGGQLELWSINFTGNRDLIAYWQPETATNPYYVHADMHAVAWHPTNPNIMFLGTDGGVFKSTDAQNQFPTFKPRNKGYNTLQFYSLGTGYDGTLLGGAQDNGTNLNDCQNNSMLSFREVQGGDGGSAEVSRINPNAMFAATPSSDVTRSSNGGQSFGGFFDDNIAPNGGFGNGFFNSPFDLWEDQYDTTLYVTRDRVVINNGSTTSVSVIDTITIPVEKSIFLLPTTAGLWFTPDALDFSNTPRWYRVSASGSVSAVGSAADGTMFVGTSSGAVTRINGMGNKYKVESFISEVTTTVDASDPSITYIDTIRSYKVVPNFGTAAGWNASANGISTTSIGAGLGGRFITGIAVNQKNPNQVVIVAGNYGRTTHVFRSLNAMDPPVGQSSPTSSWEAIDGTGLPAMPVYDAVIDYYNDNNIIIGTDLGVWATSNGKDAASSVEWYPEANGTMTSVPVFKVIQDPMYDMDCRILYVGTHGRGAFRTTTLTTNTSCDLSQCKVTSVEEHGPTANNTLQALSVYPNPVTDFTYVEFSLTEQVDVKIQIVDLMGRVVSAKDLDNLSIGDNRNKLDLSGVSAGAYIVAVSYPGKTLTRKIIVR